MNRDGLAGFFLGVGAGVCIALLFAPKSGRETRDALKSKANDGTEYLKRRGSELRDTAGEMIDRGKEAIARQKDNLTEAVEAGKLAYHETVSQEMPPAGQLVR